MPTLLTVVLLESSVANMGVIADPREYYMRTAHAQDRWQAYQDSIAQATANNPALGSLLNQSANRGGAVNVIAAPDRPSRRQLLLLLK